MWTPCRASWIITATLLAGALATPVVSRLADMFGKRRLIIIALIIMVAGCLLLALVHAYAVAIVGRAMQGVTASVLPVALSVLKDVMPPERVGSGIAIVSATLGIGSAAGLPLAGLMYGQLGFSSLFWLTGGVAALLALAAWRFLPRSGPTGRRERFDTRVEPSCSASPSPPCCSCSRRATNGDGAVARQSCWRPPAYWPSPSGSPGSCAPVAGVFDVRLAARHPVLPDRTSPPSSSRWDCSPICCSPGSSSARLRRCREVWASRLRPPDSQWRSRPPSSSSSRPFWGCCFAASAVGTSSSWAPRSMAAGTTVARVFLDGSVAQVTLGSVLIGVGSTLSLAAMPMIIMAAVPRTQTASANGVNSLCRLLGTSSSTAGLAALTSATAVTVAGHDFPSLTTIHIARLDPRAEPPRWRRSSCLFVPREHSHGDADAVRQGGVDYGCSIGATI